MPSNLLLQSSLVCCSRHQLCRQFHRSRTCCCEVRGRGGTSYDQRRSSGQRTLGQNLTKTWTAAGWNHPSCSKMNCYEVVCTIHAELVFYFSVLKACGLKTKNLIQHLDEELPAPATAISCFSVNTISGSKNLVICISRMLKATNMAATFSTKITLLFIIRVCQKSVQCC